MYLGITAFKKVVLVGGILFSLLLTLSANAEEAFVWEYKDWKTESRQTIDRVDFFTNSQSGSGDRFGVSLDQGNCQITNVWLTLSAGRWSLNEIPEDLSLNVYVDGEFIATVAGQVKSVDAWVSTKSTAFINLPNFMLGFEKYLKKGSNITFEVTGPEAVTQHFLSKSEVFSLSGFYAHSLKALETCQNMPIEIQTTPKSKPLGQLATEQPKSKAIKPPINNNPVTKKVITDRPSKAQLKESFERTTFQLDELGANFREHIRVVGVNIVESYQENSIYNIKAKFNIECIKDLDKTTIENQVKSLPIAVAPVYVLQVNLFELLKQYHSGKINNAQLRLRLRVIGHIKPKGILKRGDKFETLDSTYYRFRKTDQGWREIKE